MRSSHVGGAHLAGLAAGGSRGPLAYGCLLVDLAGLPLARLGLIDTVAGQHAVIVHPLIAETNRAHLLGHADTGLSPRLVWQAATRLMSAGLRGLNAARPADWPHYRDLTPHLQALFDTAAPNVDAESLAILLRTIPRMVHALHWSGSMSLAEDLTRTALAAGAGLEADHPAVLALRNQLAFQEGWRGRWTVAEVAFREILDARRRVLGDDHPDTLHTRHRLAEALAGVGRWAEAEAALREVLNARLDAVGDDLFHVQVTRHELAWTIAQQGRWAEAEAAFREVLDVRSRDLGGTHPSTLNARHWLAWTVARQDRWAEAEAAFREVLDARCRVFGDDHPATLATRHELAWTVARQGRWSEAEPIFRAVLDARCQTLGDDHPDTVVTRRELEVGRSAGTAELEAADEPIRDQLAAD